jgi:hypothetical protein
MTTRPLHLHAVLPPADVASYSIALLSSSSPVIAEAQLPHEPICTENLTPWLKLLPCQGRAGTGLVLSNRSRLLGAGVA